MCMHVNTQQQETCGVRRYVMDDGWETVPMYLYYTVYSCACFRCISVRDFPCRLWAVPSTPPLKALKWVCLYVCMYIYGRLLGMPTPIRKHLCALLSGLFPFKDGESAISLHPIAVHYLAPTTLQRRSACEQLTILHPIKSLRKQTIV